MAFEAVKNDYKSTYEKEIDDEKMKTLFKDLSAKASGLDTIRCRVYIWFCIRSWGYWYHIRTCNFRYGRDFGAFFYGYWNRCGALIGVSAYQGVKYITGANEISKYKQKELMLHEAIKQTQNNICNIIDDINYVVKTK